MTIDQLESTLEKGNSFGFNIKPDNKNLVSWLLLSKQKPINRFFEIFTESDDPIRYAQQAHIRNFPYQAWVAELKKDAYESDGRLNKEDYVLNETYTFADLNEVDAFLATYGTQLTALKWSSEVEFL
jgi:hypothetical protein